MASLSAGSSAARSYPVSLVLSGFYDWRATAGDKYYQNELGVWWSSNGSDPDNALDLNMSTSHLDIQASNVRQYGFPLRCVKLFIHQKYNICSKAHARHILTGLHNHTILDAHGQALAAHK